MVFCICGEYMGLNERKYHEECKEIIEFIKKKGKKKILKIIKSNVNNTN